VKPSSFSSSIVMSLAWQLFHTVSRWLAILSIADAVLPAVLPLTAAFVVQTLLICLAARAVNGVCTTPPPPPPTTTPPPQTITSMMRVHRVILVFTENGAHVDYGQEPVSLPRVPDTHAMERYWIRPQFASALTDTGRPPRRTRRFDPLADDTLNAEWNAAERTTKANIDALVAFVRDKTTAAAADAEDTVDIAVTCAVNASPQVHARAEKWTRKLRALLL